MAKVGKRGFSIGTKHEVDYDLYYTQSRGFEIRGITEEFFNITGVRSSGYSTENQLVMEITKAIPKYHETKCKERLVIGYRMKASTELRMNKVKEGTFHGVIDGVSNKIDSFEAFTTPRCSIGIDYDIYMEVFNGKENEYYPVDEDHKISSSSQVHYNSLHGRTFIAYTEENYSFFEYIKKGMTNLVKKMSVFFDLENKEAEQLIQRKINLLE